MTKFEFFDALQLVEPRRTNDGYLVADVRAARTGIQLYRGSEIGLPEKDVVRVLRPEEEVFKDSSMASFAHKPVTMGHPTEMVDSKSWKRHSIGSIGDKVARDGEFIIVPLSVMDEDAVSAIEAGTKELSAGYTCDFDFTAGVTDGGEEYDAIQRDIRINHVAVVKKGRAGPKCRLGDSQPKEKPMTRKIVVDGITIETTDQGAEAIEKLQKQVTDVNTALDSANKSHSEAIKAKDQELGKKDAEIEKLKGAQPTADQLDTLVAERAAVVERAKKIGDVDPKGKTNAEIRRAAVALKVGDEKVKDKSDDYIEAMFDALSEGTSDPVRDALRGSKQPTNVNVGDADKAYDEHVDSLTNAWKGETTNA